MSLTLIMGPMFAGKSSAIIRIVNRHRCIRTPILLISHSSDNRYGADETVTNHDSLSIPCKKSSILQPFLDTEEYKNAKLIIIEESQFFPDLKNFVLHSVEEDCKEVFVVGLDGDADRKPFGQILDLVPYADKITKLKAFCSMCCDGTEALFSFCKARELKQGQVCVGGEEMYTPLCRKHYVERMKAADAYKI
jgi:thymidine kinase